MKIKITAAALVVTMFAGWATAASTQYGAVAPDGIKPVALGDVLKDADGYKDKTILATGQFYGLDPDGDEFYFKDGANIIEVSPPLHTHVMTELKINTAISVYGKVSVRHRGDKTIVSMIADGVGVQ